MSLRRLRKPTFMATRFLSQKMEKPCVLATRLGSPGAIFSCFSPLIEKHFTLVAPEMVATQPELNHKIQVVLVWGNNPPVNLTLLKSLPNLKAIVNGGVGVDHLEIALINSFGVKVSNTPNVVDNSTADMAMGLMLTSGRRIIQGDRFSRDHKDGEDLDESLLGTDISGGTLGIVGMGRIGYKVAKRAAAFDMKILYHNRNRRPEEEERSVGATYCPMLADLLGASDFIVVAVNLTKQSTHLIGREQLSAMKPSATLINISRGMVVDQEALVEALQNKWIRTAALDVTYPEPLPRDHPLLSLPDVIVLPHMGTHTLETSGHMVQRMLTNALAAMAGETPPDEVTV